MASPRSSSRGSSVTASPARRPSSSSDTPVDTLTWKAIWRDATTEERAVKSQQLLEALVKSNHDIMAHAVEFVSRHLSSYPDRVRTSYCESFLNMADTYSKSRASRSPSLRPKDESEDPNCICSAVISDVSANGSFTSTGSPRGRKSTTFAGQKGDFLPRQSVESNVAKLEQALQSEVLLRKELEASKMKIEEKLLSTMHALEQMTQERDTLRSTNAAMSVEMETLRAELEKMQFSISAHHRTLKLEGKNPKEIQMKVAERVIKRWQNQSLGMVFSSWKGHIIENLERKERSEWEKEREVLVAHLEEEMATNTELANINSNLLEDIKVLKEELDARPTHSELSESVESNEALAIRVHWLQRRSIQTGFFKHSMSHIVLCFHNWTRYTRRMRARKAAMKFAINKWVHHRTFVTFTQWKGLLHKRRESLRLVLRNLPYHLFVLTFQQWRDYMRLTRRQRIKELETVERGLLTELESESKLRLRYESENKDLLDQVANLKSKLKSSLTTLGARQKSRSMVPFHQINQNGLHESAPPEYINTPKGLYCLNPRSPTSPIHPSYPSESVQLSPRRSPTSSQRGPSPTKQRSSDGLAAGAEKGPVPEA